MNNLQQTVLPEIVLSTHEAPISPLSAGLPSLTEQTVAVVTARIGAPDLVKAWDERLSAAERERADRFRYVADRNRFVVGRGVLRSVLSGYLGVAAGSLEFELGANGKPALSGQSGDRRIEFNLSHSGDVVMIAFVWNHRVGVDVELFREDIEVQNIAQRYFSTAEQADLLALPELDQIPAFFRCWTRKEAYVKAVGGGLSLPLSDFDVSLLPGEPTRLVATRPDADEARRWKMWNLDAGPSYAAALAVSPASAVAQPDDHSG